ncbi:MAG TPA: hypothetical protein VM052_03625 [Candidatus Limnocylindrales bacterium]|nr:hypothetical protein [Candidatus Limnocylindrales bacterium]
MPKAGLFLFVSALAIIALLFAIRPQDAVQGLPGLPTVPPTSLAPTSSPASSAVAASVPAACRSLVHGMTFSTGTLDDRARDAQSWVESHRGQEASVVITDAILNDAATRESQSMPVRDLRVAIEPAGFRLSANAVAFATFPIKVLLVPVVSAGSVRIETRDLDTDGLPGFFRGNVEDSIRRAADPSAWGLRMRVNGVATQNGCAVIWGTA